MEGEERGRRKEIEDRKRESKRNRGKDIEGEEREIGKGRERRGRRKGREERERENKRNKGKDIEMRGKRNRKKEKKHTLGILEEAGMGEGMGAGLPEEEEK